eukprot:237167_1
MTPLMYACSVLHIPLIEALLKYGPNIEARDAAGHDCKWHCENNHWVTTDNIISRNTTALVDFNVIDKITAHQMNERKAIALRVLNRSIDDISEEEDDFIEAYEERYDEFVVSDRMAGLTMYRSTKYDVNVLFEAIVSQDFQRIIDMIDEDTFDANMPSVDGTTALHFACEHSGALVIKFLMDRGAYPFKIQSNGRFPIDLIDDNKTADEE